MSYFKRKNNAYSKLNKEDPEDTIHRKAQFLIYKAMEEAETVGSHSDHQKKTTTTMSFLRIMRFCKVKVKIGSRLKNLRRRMFSTKPYMRMMMKQLKSCKRLFGAAGGDQAVNVAGRIPSLLI